MLDMTPKDIQERTALRINPAKTCQPIGAMYASLGIHNCLPHSHGSQGCCSYHRSHLTRHFKEPVVASTSSFTEGAAVFGGAPNLRQSLKTIFQVYKPDIIAVHTTCLSETIGDDIPSIVRKAEEDGLIPDGKFVIHANTPSYVGSNVTGFSNMVKAMVDYLATRELKPDSEINVIPGYVDPADMREIKRMLGELNVTGTVFPDTSDVLDTPMTGSYEMFPKGGVTIERLMKTGSGKVTIALGAFASEAGALALETKCGVPFQVLDLPIGINATDQFVKSVLQITGEQRPSPSMSDDRGRVLDMMTDMQHYLYGKRVAIYGDPDHVISMTDFLVSAGMRPVYVITGTPGKRFEERIKRILGDDAPNCVIRASADLFYLHQLIRNESVDLMVGNTYGKYIARAEDIPLVRFGFPILDRVGHGFFPTFGYRGAMYMLTNIINTLLDRVDRDSAEERFELVM